MKIQELCRIAERIASKSPCRYKVSCILVDDGGDVVATGYNYHCSTGRKMGKPTVHAEMDALSKVRKPSRNLTAFVYRKSGKIITPCKACQSLLDAYKIDVVWHTAGRKGDKITIKKERKEVRA